MPKPKTSNADGKSTVYHLTADHNDLTLAAALKSITGDQSWGQVKKWIAKRFVQVNGNLCLDEARRVSEKDVIKLWAAPMAKPVEARDLKIVHVDEHLLVVEKPAGVTSVRHVAERKISTRRRQLQPTLDELLPPAMAKKLHLRWPPLPPVGMNRGRRRSNLDRRGSPKAIQNAKKLPPELQVFPVHRLDRDTSGLMLFARTRAAEQKLTVHFRRHQIHREYVAICWGAVEPQTIQSWLVRDCGNGKRGSLPNDATDEQKAAAAEAVSHVLAVDTIREPSSEHANSLSKTRIKLETGRTHQIRIHLSEAGHPVCGDKIYGSANSSTEQRIPEPPRQALHSDLIRFKHPFTGEEHEFRMPFPADLQNWLKKIKA